MVGSWGYLDYSPSLTTAATVSQVTIEVNHCLMALPGTKVEDLTVCMSHPQALAQW